MTLTIRLTLFFLTALAVVLAAFIGTLYSLARSHLHASLEAHGNTTMNTLVALAEIEPDGLDWEPELRRLPTQWEGDPPVWAIDEEYGIRIDGSPKSGHPLSAFATPGSSAARESFPADWNSSEWRVTRQSLVFPNPSAIRSRPGRERHRTLVFVTAWSVAPVRGELLTLVFWK